VISADRDAGTGFAATVYGTEAPPWPFVFASETQFALVLADHVQSRVVSTASVPCPPSAVNAVVGDPTWTWHFTDTGAVTAVDVCDDVQPKEPPPRARATTNPNT
jgi:hypothetical protein